MSPQLTDQDLVDLTEVMSHIFRIWGVSSETQRSLLGLSPVAAEGLRAPLEEGGAFPAREECLDRAEQLMAIHECLRTAYPRSGAMAAHWLKQPHRRMDLRTPLDVMLEDGLPGLKQVRGLLDCTQNWV
jgi:hypothetical protein